MRRFGTWSLAIMAGLSIAASVARGDLPTFGAAASPTSVGTPPRGLVSVDAHTCGACHEQTYARWADSMHRRSYTAAYFQAGYREDRFRFCRNCHAPRGPADAEPTGHAATDGVDCATCHVRDEMILAVNVTRAGQQAHAMRREPSLRDARFCAGCHQFSFPAPPLVERAVFDPSLLMQSTHDEWAQSDAHREGRTCQSCHMPGGDHRVLGLRDEAFRASAVEVTAHASRREDGSTRLRLDLDARGAGHAVPTGDVLRQLEVVARVDDVEDVIRLGRRFAPVHAGIPGRSPVDEVGDDRIGAPGQPARRNVFLTLPASSSPIDWELSILRARPSLARRQGLSEQQNRVPLVRGTLPSPPRTAP